jgi:hypothetical protein
MPLIVNQNHNSVILNDIINWLSQTKVSGQANLRLPLGEVAIIGGDGFDIGDITLDQTAIVTLDQLSQLQLNELDCNISFYTDAAKTILAFTDNTGANPADWAIIGKKLFYTPPDSLINNAPGLSTTLCQPLYYVTATYTDGTVFETTYKNSANLMFQSVTAASKGSPQFAKDQNQAIIVPSGEKSERKMVAGDFNYLLSTVDIYVQQNILNWDGLSELERLTAQQQVVNTIRNSLYIDRTRNGQCCFHDKDIRGTGVGDMKVIKSDALLKCCVQVKTATLVNSNGY